MGGGGVEGQTAAPLVQSAVEGRLIQALPSISQNALTCATLQPGGVARAAMNDSQGNFSFGIGVDGRRNASAFSSNGGAAFINVFALNSAVESSLNYAKVSYFSPRLFGLQLGVSFTPSEGKYVIPFANNGPNVPNRQKSMWEAAFNYSDSFGPVTLSAYGGLIVGPGAPKTPGRAGPTHDAGGALARGRHPGGVARRNPDPETSDVFGKTIAAGLSPRVAAIGGFVQSRPRPTGRRVHIPGSAPHLPQRGIDCLRMSRLKGEVDRPGVHAFAEHPLPMRAAVARAEHATLGIGTIRMPQRSDEQGVRIAGIDDDPADLLAVRQADLCPVFSVIT